jgi:hypothetical protein
MENPYPGDSNPVPAKSRQEGSSKKTEKAVLFRVYFPNIQFDWSGSSEEDERPFHETCRCREFAVVGE